MWDAEAIAKSAFTVGAPLVTVIGFGSRRRRLRAEIRENLALAEQVQESEAMRGFGLAGGWLHGRIALDIAKLTGQDIGTAKKPIPWGSVVLAAVLTAGFGAISYWFNRDGFAWYSVVPGSAAFVFAVSIISMFTDREKSPEDSGPLPLGAVVAPTRTARERVATGLAISAAGGRDDRLEPGGQADVVLRFVQLLRLGAYGAALDLADENWFLCRLKAWLWNNREHFGGSEEELDGLVIEMLDRGSDDAHPVMLQFVESEARQFATAWADIDFHQYGLAGNRRRIAADLDLVILAPVGSSGGYFVVSATVLPEAMTFLVRRSEAGWRVANHLGVAPPLASWPPVWWTTDDPVIAALPDLVEIDGPDEAL